MSHVKLPLVSRDFLVGTVDQEPLLREDAACRELLLEALKYHLLPEQRASLVSARTTDRRPDAAAPYLFSVGQFHTDGQRLAEVWGLRGLKLFEHIAENM